MTEDTAKKEREAADITGAAEPDEDEELNKNWDDDWESKLRCDFDHDVASDRLFAISAEWAVHHGTVAYMLRETGIHHVSLTSNE